ncbi:MAG TPA: CcmD family protein [Candidatus Binataceae bacterium]|nr:CcmD family protein [Candidatus Binataceae bacterium]
MEHFDYLFAAYSIIFLVIFGYVIFMWRQQARLEVEIHAMEERLKNLKTTQSSADAKSAAQK